MLRMRWLYLKNHIAGARVMRRMMLLALGVTIALWSSTGMAAVRTTLPGQIHSLAVDVKKSLAEDPRLLNQPLQLGKFDGEGEASATNFGLRIEQILRGELAE